MLRAYRRQYAYVEEIFFDFFVKKTFEFFSLIHVLIN